VQDRVQDADAKLENGEGTAEPAKPRRTPAKTTAARRARRFERENGGETDTDLSPRALLTRLEQQSGQLGILRSKLDETRKALARERESAHADREALYEERRNRERLEATLKRERVARQQAEETVDEARATASALEAQHHLLRAQLKALEHESSGRRRFVLRRGR
jgi:vacuolar-type H+-ATPase subunit I/STV1